MCSVCLLCTGDTFLVYRARIAKYQILGESNLPHLQKDIRKSPDICPQDVYENLVCQSRFSIFTTCKLPSLRKRRLFLKLCILYQVVNDLITFPSHNISLRDVREALIQHNSLNPDWNESYKQSFIFPDVISNWNNLPSDIKSAFPLYARSSFA